MSNLRIVGGYFSGRLLRAPRGRNIHPMSERMRSALFSMLGDIQGLRVLDAFGGSGALGLEAASRGAGEVTIVDNNSKAQRIIQQNIERLQAGNVSQVKGNVFSWLSVAPHGSFDVVFADPPYDVFDAEKIERLTSLITDGGLLVVSAPADEEFELDLLEFVDRREYAGGSLHFWRNNK